MRVRKPRVSAAETSALTSLDWSVRRASSFFQLRLRPLKPTTLKTSAEKPGIYEVELEAEWDEIDGMEFTIALVHGCVSGELVFLGATVSSV